MVWENYTSDGEDPTRIYPMEQDPDTGEWVVGAEFYDLSFTDPFDLNPLAPSVFEEAMVEQLELYTNKSGQRVKKSAGFRYYLREEWPSCALDERGILAALSSMGIGQRVRVYPHNDHTIYYDCVITENNVMAKEHVGDIRYPSYAPIIAFESVHLIKIIPHSWGTYHYHFIDKTAWGAYTVAERQRAVTMRDKTAWAAYLVTDYKGFFTAKQVITPGV